MRDWRIFNSNLPNLDQLIERIEVKKEKLDQFRPIPDIVLSSIRDSLYTEWTYNSNSIEGNTLSLNETRMVLQDGMTVKGKSLREHFEVLNHHEAIDMLEELVSPSYQINEGDIMEVHAKVLDRIEKDHIGRFRTSGVRIVGANFVPPNALKVPSLFAELVEWVNTSSDTYHTIVRASIFHHRFVWVHPFFDGNGRTARLIFNMLFMKEGYPPAVILRNDRKKYYDALNRANNGNYVKFIQLVAQTVERSLDIYLAALEDRQEDFRIISSIVEEPEIPYGQEYVSLLARKGQIAAHKEGRNWYTTKDAVLDYMKNRQRIRN